MRRICYAVAMSLDDFIAGPHGEYDWITIDPEIDFRAIFARFDILLMSRRTFEVALATGRGAPMPGTRSVIVSRTLRAVDHRDVTVIGKDLPNAPAHLRAEPARISGSSAAAPGSRACSNSVRRTRSMSRSNRSFWVQAFRCLSRQPNGRHCGWSAARP